MKKIARLLLVLSLSFLFILGAKTDVYAAGATLTGPNVVRAGDTITLKLNISDNGKFGLEGSLSYDASIVTLSSMTSSMNGWKVENNGNAIIVYDDNMTNPINGTKTVLTLKFKVNNGVAEGTPINISVNGVVTTDGSTESNIGTAGYSATVAAPLSSNTNLSALSVAEGKLNPGFSAGNTTYSIPEVEFSVSKLNITYKTEDPKSTVSITGNELVVGANTVSVTVKAENGATKTYKISVTRKQDPNYVASSNAALGGITISGGTISPGFSSEVTDYIVYLPYEYVGQDFSATGNAADAKALGVTGGTISPLVEGVNTTTVVCKAEDGTEKTYKITVLVMPEYKGSVPNIEGVDAPEKDDETDVEDMGDAGNKDNSVAGPIAIVFILILIGALIYVLFFLNKNNRTNLRGR